MKISWNLPSINFFLQKNTYDHIDNSVKAKYIQSTSYLIILFHSSWTNYFFVTVIWPKQRALRGAHCSKPAERWCCIASLRSAAQYGGGGRSLLLLGNKEEYQHCSVSNCAELLIHYINGGMLLSRVVLKKLQQTYNASLQPNLCQFKFAICGKLFW